MTDLARFGLDAEIIAYIERSETALPADSVAMDIQSQRANYDTLCAMFDVPLPADVTTRDSTVRAGTGAAIPVRHYSPANALADTLVLFFHGGGYVLGSLDSHHAICGEICSRAGFDLVAVDYRLAPEHPHPAQYEDCLAAYRHYAALYRRIVLVGDSAGGNLAASICAQTRSDDPKPVGAVLIYPALGGDWLDLDSYRTMADAPLLTAADIESYHRLRHGGDPQPDPTAHPLLVEDFNGHPPTIIISAAVDPLCDDGEAYAARLEAAGTAARFVREAGLVHGYLRARHMSEKARQSFDTICAAVGSLARDGVLP